MFRSKMVAAAAIVLGLVLLFYLRQRSLQKPRPHTEETYHQAPTTGRQTLTVAFIPVTCHLTARSRTTRQDGTTGTEFSACASASCPRSSRL
jgi:hypothetical protein